MSTNSNQPRLKTFTLGELFVADKGDIDLQQTDVNGKGCCFINSGTTNSGIKGKTNRAAKVFPANTITIDFWGNAYYRDFEYKLATHNHVFSLSGDVIKNELVGLYLVGAMSRLPKLFSYSNMATWPKLQPIEIELPIIKKLVPDWEALSQSVSQSVNQSISQSVSQSVSHAPGRWCDMSKIDTTGWQEFRIGDLFKVQPTKGYKMNNAELFETEGNTPVLSNSSINNGIGGRCGLVPTEDGGIITFSDTTSGADTMFYQAEPFIGYAHVQGMYPIGFELNKEIALFMISAMRAAFSTDYNYANKFNRTIVMNTTVLLPVKETEEIDYEYMEERIRELEEERIRELDAYLKVTCLENDVLTDLERQTYEQLAEKKFDEFAITDIFDVDNTNSIMKGQIKSKGNIPYVTAGSDNNAIADYIEYDHAYLERGNSLMIGGKTMVITYQEQPYFSNDSHNLTLLLLREDKRTENTYLFLIGALKAALGHKYHWGDSISKTKIKKDAFLLPVDDDGNPDFDFMDRYIAAQKKLVIQSVNEWRQKEIETAKAVVS